MPFGCVLRHFLTVNTTYPQNIRRRAKDYRRSCSLPYPGHGGVFSMSVTTVIGTVPGVGSDHRAFALTGIPAVGVTVSPRADEAKLREYVDEPNSLKWQFRFLRPTTLTQGDCSRDVIQIIEDNISDILNPAFGKKR